MVGRAFGLSLDFDRPPPGAWEARPGGRPALRMQLASPGEIADSWSGREEIGWKATIDDAPFVAERGLAGDFRFVHGDRSTHHLSANRSVLRCALGEEGPIGWRVVLDSVLFSVALISGYEALHAGAVATDEGAIAIAAGAGGGKSTLLVQLLRQGLPLLSDDVVVLEGRDGEPPLAHPGAPVMTVPASIDPPPGVPIAAAGEERWTAVPAHREEISLAALVVLDRRPGLSTGLHRVQSPLASLIGSLLRFPLAPERERARFELASAIASQVPIWELGADPSVDPATLAGLLEAENLSSRGE